MISIHFLLLTIDHASDHIYKIILQYKCAYVDCLRHAADGRLSWGVKLHTNIHEVVL